MVIGFVGLGIMGKPMAKNLCRAGYTLIVNDHHKENVDELVQAGARSGDLKQIGMESDVVITMLPNSPHVKDVMLGENGIAVYYYEDASATVEEILFVKTMESYDMLKLDIGSLAYITENAQDFYLLLQGMIYRIDLKTREYERVVDGVNTECYTVSKSNRYVAWL